jgi:hypothetical protein
MKKKKRFHSSKQNNPAFPSVCKCPLSGNDRSPTVWFAIKINPIIDEYLQTHLQSIQIELAYSSLSPTLKMVSSCSSSGSTASAYPANMSQSLAIPTSTRVPPSSSKNKAQEVGVQGAFKCKLCPRAFKSARARGSHQKAHRQQPTSHKNKKKTAASKGRRHVCVWSPSGIWPCSYATALRSACLRAWPFEDWSSHYDLSVRPMTPSFPWQRGTSTGSLAAAPAAGRTRTEVRLLRLQDVREVGQEEPADGIDLTLKL